MKAFFIYKDGELIGNPLGYTTEEGAKKSLVGTEDWYKILRRYEKNIEGYNNITEEQKQLGLWMFYERIWLFRRDKWTRKIWTPYVKEYYKFVEKEFDIVFKD